jgi:glycosyltransferase involved in cell wall biosynthesis
MLKFSIVVPLFNKEKFIKRTLNSISEQIYQNFEVLIVDDGSTDNSRLVVEQWVRENGSEKYQIIRQENAGVAAARNLGVISAKQEYVAFIDADDYWHPSHLSTIAELIGTYGKSVDMFSTAAVHLQNDNTYYPNLAQYENFEGVVDFFQVTTISNGFVNSSSVCVRRSAMEKKLFPLGMKNYEDVITWARISEARGFAFSSKRTSVYVIDNASASLNVEFESYLKFESLLEEINYDKKARYQLRFYILHLMFCRSELSLGNFLESTEGLRKRGKFLLKLSCWIVTFFPQSLIRKLRNARKTAK